jgi:tRNA threonylcarbamoyladenosine biosynthesis protein TsaB
MGAGTPRVKLLAFDTSTETLSVAVARGAHAPVLSHEGVGGAQASTTLIPAALALLQQAGVQLADLDAIVFGRGPGSFTGLRTACAVAQGLGFGGQVPVLAVDTLMAVAEEARHAAGHTQVLALLDARMDEVYCATYAYDGGLWETRQPPALARPDDLVLPPGYVIAGNARAAYGNRLPAGATVFDALPRAAALLRLAPALIAAGRAQPAAEALPLYIRDKVAQTTEERAAHRAASAAAAPQSP